MTLHVVDKSSEVKTDIYFFAAKNTVCHKYFQNERHKFEYTFSGSLTQALFHASTLLPSTMQCHQQKSLHAAV